MSTVAPLMKQQQQVVRRKSLSQKSFTSMLEGKQTIFAREWENLKYFEIELKKIQLPDLQGKLQEFILFEIKDITAAITSQQKKSDLLYQDAIEANYSHEQMNPLNNIVQNSSTVHRMISKLLEESKINENQQQMLTSLKLVQAVSHSAVLLWYFNQNQIARMKIKKKEFVTKETPISNVLDHLSNVITPFMSKIKKTDIKVLLSIKLPNCRLLYSDWEVFELILFNLIQNSVKYNRQGGIIFVIVQMDQSQPQTKSNQSEQLDARIKVHVVDTGEGIDRDRQNLLFRPFLELQQKQSMQLVKDNSIGLGLACSYDLAKQMGGSIKLEKSDKDRLTAFSFSMGVKYKAVNSALISVEYVENDEHTIVINQRFQNSFPELQQYLNAANVVTAVEFQFKNELEKLQEKV